MSQIPLNSRAKRPAFFGDSGMDSVVTMLMEMMTELWVVKEQGYRLKKILDEAGLDVSEKIESYELSAAELAELETARRAFIENMMRAFEAESISRDQLQQQTDQLTESMKEDDSISCKNTGDQ